MNAKNNLKKNIARVKNLSDLSTSNYSNLQLAYPNFLTINEWGNFFLSPSQSLFGLLSQTWIKIALTKAFKPISEKTDLRPSLSY